MTARLRDARHVQLEPGSCALTPMLLWKSRGGFDGDRPDHDVNRSSAVDATFPLIIATRACLVIDGNGTWAARMHRMSRSC
ncbi:hypothetical protein BJF90_29730 [Pseudonocardia sp. CNS-004]|nr:hypothetical protein BJF90_29730 [Pseudonocardia sp. CNS-004]